MAVSSTSLTNTPQAKDDNYAYTEDQLLSNASIYNSTTKTITLDVMSNDLGGAAKSLYSIDDGEGALSELLQSNVTTSWEATDKGWIRISNGKIEYRIDDGSHSLESARDVNSLGEGETFTDTFLYTIRMGNGTLSYATVTVKLTGENDGPTANSDAASTGEDSSVLVDVLANDTDPDTSDTLSISDAQITSGLGEVTIEDGKLRYEPGSNYNGLDDGESATVTISYTVDDGHGGTSTSTVSITVNGANDAPVTGGDDSASGTEDDASIGGRVPTATDVDGEAVTYQLVSGSVKIDGVAAADDTVTLNSDGSYSYTPTSGDQSLDDGESHVITFDYVATDGDADSDASTVTITVDGVNDAPVTGGDDSASGTEDDTSIDGTVPAATDVDGEAVAYQLVSGSVKIDGVAAADGTVTLNADGTYSYTPTSADQALDDNESHVITFDYVASDGDATSDAATVTITVDGVNDAPVTGGVDSASGTEDDSSIGGTVPAATDVDGEAVTYQLVTGSVKIDGVAAADGTVTLNSDGSYSYTPIASDQGLDDGESHVITFDYVASDGDAQSDAATVTITVDGANDAPVTGGEDSASGTEDDASIGGTVPAATDGDGEAVTYQLVSGSVQMDGVAAADGTVTLNADGTYSYTPTTGDQGLDDGESHVITFDYVASDGDAASDAATVTITMDGVNDAPVTGGVDSASGTEDDASIGGTVPAATDVDGEAITYQLVSGSVKIDGVAAADGTVTLNSDGSYSYTPASGDQDLDDGEAHVITFDYVAIDGDAQSDAATVTITVDGVTDAPADAAPTANDDVWVLSDGTLLPAATITPSWFLNNDSDGDSPALFVTNVTGLPAGMTANYDGSGHLISITGTTPAAGSYVLTYTTSDGTSTSTAMVTMNVLDTTSNADSFTLNGNDFSYVDLLSGADTINGDVTLTGNAGNDIFVGNNGSDTLRGGAGDDRLSGSENNDALFGGDGHDILDGGNNSDTLTGGAGHDTLTGGAGTDVFVLTSAAAADSDTITDYAAGEVIDISAFLGTSGSLSGFVRLTAAGELQVDIDGGGNDYVTVATISAGVNAVVRYSSGSGTATTAVVSGAPPVAIDLNGDGAVSFLDADSGVAFDYGGGEVATAWVAPEDGILVRDANHDGAVTSDEMVFATSGSDLDGLATYDSNNDGTLDSSDSGFADFAVWQDSNSNGVVDSGEMQTLTALGITSISLTSDGVSYTAAGGDVTVVGTGSFTRADGTTGVLADSVFATGARTSDDQTRASSALPGNAALLGAVAAAGLLSVPVQAAVHAGPEASIEGVTVRQVAGAEHASVSAQATGDDHAVTGETAVPLQAHQEPATSHEGSPQDASMGEHSEAAVSHESMQPLTELAQDQAPAEAHASEQPLMLSESAPVVSAAMLQAAMAGVEAAASGNPQSAVDAGQHAQGAIADALADALAGGGAQVAAVDSLLQSLGGGEAQSHLAQAMLHQGAIDDAMMSAFMPAHTGFAAEMVVHMDAPPAA